MNHYISKDKNKLAELCNIVRRLVQQSDFTQCEKLIFNAMGKYPHAPEPHNLIGVLLEKKGDHIAAMKHFRAARALDPAYIPARCNLGLFASFYTNGKCAFDESDCPMDEENGCQGTEYDSHDVGHVIRRD